MVVAVGNSASALLAVLALAGSSSIAIAVIKAVGLQLAIGAEGRAASLHGHGYIEPKLILDLNTVQRNVTTLKKN